MATELRVTGLDDVIAKLNALPREVVSKRGGPVKLALAKGARLLRDAARAQVPVDTGLARESIIAKRAKMYGGNGERYIVTLRKLPRKYANTRRNVRGGKVGKFYEVDGPAYYAKFLEYGTTKMPARPFLRPALAANAQRVTDEVTRDLVRRVDLLAKKWGAG